MDWNEEFFVGRDEQMGKNGRDSCFIEFRTDAVRLTCQTASLEHILFGDRLSTAIPTALFSLSQ
jgi:hypothetical protein